MNIDELFRPDVSTASQQLKTQLDSDVETLAGSFDEILNHPSDTLMIVNIYTMVYAADEENPDSFLTRRAGTFRQDIAGQFRCIGNCSRLLMRDGTSDRPDAIDYKHIVFSFDRRFSSAIEIIRFMNAVYSYFSQGSACHMEFYKRYLPVSNFMDSFPEKFSYTHLNRNLFHDRCNNDSLVTLKSEYLNLVHLVYELLPKQQTDLPGDLERLYGPMNTMMMSKFCQPDGQSDIRPYEQLCKRFNVSMYETDIIEYIFSRHGIKNSPCSIADCKVGEGVLEKWDGKIPIDGLCNDTTDEIEFILAGPKREMLTDKMKLNISGTSNKTSSIRTFLNRLSSIYGMTYVRQFTVYWFQSASRYEPPIYMILIRLQPVWSDDTPTEVVYKRIHREYALERPSLTGYETEGYKICRLLSSMFYIRFPDSFIRDFDDALEREQEYQLRQQILYHGRNH